MTLETSLSHEYYAVKNMALTEEHGMEKNFQKLNGELRIGTRPNEGVLDRSD